MRIFFRPLFWCLALVGFNGNCFAQSTDPAKWAITLSGGIEAHDKRLGSLPGQAFLLETQPAFFGTYSSSIGLQKLSMWKDGLVLSYGINLLYSRATFRRPYEDASLPDDVARDDIFLWVDDYRELMFAPTLSLNRSVTDRFSVGLFSQAKIRYYLYMKDLGDRVAENYEGPWALQFRSLEVYGDLAFDLSKSIRLTGRYRITQLLHNDPNLINRTIFSPAKPEMPPPPDFQFYNPVKLELAISYSW